MGDRVGTRVAIATGGLEAAGPLGPRWLARELGPARRWFVAAGVLSAVVAVALTVAGTAVMGAGDSSRAVPAGGGWASLPIAARAAVSRGLGTDERSYWARDLAGAAVALRNPAQGLDVTLSGGRIAIRGSDGVRLGLDSLTVARALTFVSPLRLGAATATRNRVVLSSPGVSEWIANGPWGLEQGFTLTHRPLGSGPLTISQRVSGNLHSATDAGGQGVTFSSHAGSLRYEELIVTDARGRRVPARIGLSAGRVTITIDDAHAVYPLRVDPTIQQTAELTA
jgi:hypothetical protein